MAKKTNPTIRYEHPGQPTKYRPEYGQMLIDHMKTGGSLTSFGAIVGVTRQTLHNWMDEHKPFFDARKLGEAHLINFLEQMSKTMASGQLRRVKSEKPVLDSHGEPVVDPTTGQVLYEREYEPATPAQAAFIFYAKNVSSGSPSSWKDRHDVELSGKDGGPITFSGMSDAQIQDKIAELIQRAKAK